MRVSLPTDLLLKLMLATPEQFAAVERVLDGVTPLGASGGHAGRSFTRCGDHWKVVFDGHELHLSDSLGARYLAHLLQHPNQPIAAFDLERTITPEKASARSANSRDAGRDGQAVRQWLREVERLRAERDETTERGDYGKAERLDTDIAALEMQLKGERRTHDTGERARNNVRKAISAVRRGLLRGNAAQKSFAAHLTQFVDTGYSCIYHQPPGAEWA